MTRRLFLAALFIVALLLAVAGWTVAGARLLLTAPARRFRRREELPLGRFAS